MWTIGIVLLAFLVQETTGFSSGNINSGRTTTTTTTTTTTHLDMIATGGNFFEEFRSERRDGSGGEDDSNPNMNNNQNNQMRSSSSSTKFVTGDDLHRLRHQVMAMHLELQEARRTEDVGRVRDLERAIMKTQQVDAEFVYTVSLERKELALQAGNALDAQRFHEKALEARSSLPQFQLEGLWVGKYGEDQGYEMINVTYIGDTLMAHKVTSGTKHVPRGAETFRVDFAPQFINAMESSSISNGRSNNRRVNSGGSEPRQHQQQQNNQPENHELAPIELGESAAKQWGCKYLQRFSGQGQVASEGYQDSQWMEGQLILVNEYFSFAWLPIGHQVFFGRPTPELILKLMKDETKRKSSAVGIASSPARSFLEKCWEETEHIADDMEADRQQQQQQTSSNNYDQEGCFE